MHRFYHLSLIILLCCTAITGLQAQDGFPIDSLCVPFTPNGQIANLFSDDGIIIPPGSEDFFIEGNVPPCFSIDRQGNLSFSQEATEERCCGRDFTFFVGLYRRNAAGGADLIGEQEVSVTIKCPKPDCGLVNLDDIPPPDPTTNPDEPTTPVCIKACENSTATYLFTQNPALTYNWLANGAPVTITTPGQITVTWGSIADGGVLSVTILDANGDFYEARTFCVDLSPTPVADFTFNNVACLGQDVYFMNTTTGGTTYDWDFGDGVSSTDANPVHPYDTPGTYSVTLVATSGGGLNPDGSQACCCTDSISYDITIDPLPGPNIFWISTLCEGDVSKYWTDATGCSPIEWSISGNGTPLTPLVGVDTIEVQWNSGPTGTIKLEVDNCDQDYCPNPAVAIVPIISSVGDISGPTEVCAGETANYELPKWMTVAYDWATSPGATINGSNAGHIVNITWPTTPGTYVIEVAYGSDFLAGLPGHMGDDCYGTARLEVTVLGDFDLTAAPSPACYEGGSFFNGNSNIDPGATFDWEIVGHPGFEATGPNYSVNWSDLPGPGAYTIAAEVTNPDDYCVARHTITVVVKDAQNPTIDGPLTYCAGQPVIFSVAAPAPGYTYTWSIPAAAGTITAGQGGPIVTVVFNVNSGAVLSVTGQDGNAPNCVSDPATIAPTGLTLNEPVVITGPPACTNSEAAYTIDMAQPGDATYSWSVEPAIAGSVVSGADGPMANIQWNNAPGITVEVKLTISLCGDDLDLVLPLTLNTPDEPVIVQTGTLCPGNSVDLSIDPIAFDSIRWVLGANAGAMTGLNTPTITVTEPGDYVVFTFDQNGCPGVDRFRVESADGPEVSIGITGARSICVTNTPYPPNPILTVTASPTDTIEWFCGGVSQGPGVVGNPTFSHVWTSTLGSFAYTAKATDINGCMSVSDPIIVTQRNCCGPPFVSDPISKLHTLDLVQQTPNCDVIDLVATWSPDSVDCAGFDLPLYSTVLSFGGSDALGNDSLTARLPGVGCYDISHEIFVWAFDYDTTFVIDANGNQNIDEIFKADSIKCGRPIFEEVCVPLFADFDFSEQCGKVSFVDESSFIGVFPPADLTYTWDFDDAGATSNDANPMHEYTSNGSYTVTLTISDGDCESTATITVDVTDIPDPAFTVSPNPVCEDQPAIFSGSGTNIISWFWRFGDGATFVGNDPQHTYSGLTSAEVTLIVTNSAGCTDSIKQTIDIFPTPAEDTIAYSNGLIICDGDETILSVVDLPDHDYLWSTGATTSSITVDAAGTYGVTITNDDGCERVIDPVEVQIVPKPDVSWIGNPFICDNGSTLLTALAGGGHIVEWRNVTTGQVVLGSDYNVPFSPGNTFQDVVLKVINVAFGCMDSTALVVEQAISPAPNAAITMGDACEGTGTRIEVINFDPALTYTWSTGATGQSIFVFAAGTYTVIATDERTGCSGSDQVTINPLPDLCLVPTGCYESCKPDTLHAPQDPNYSYQWIKDGVPVPAPEGIADFLIVEMSATYNVMVTNNITGCDDTSDDLILVVIDCDETDCDDIVTRLRASDSETSIGDCCFELYYDNVPDNVYAIQVSSPDADLAYVPGSADAAFGSAGNSAPNVIQLAVDGIPSAPVPGSMTANSAATFCPLDVTSVPQMIIIEYLGMDFETVICSDTLFTDCPDEPDCVFITEDDLYCDDDGNLTFTFTFCNPVDGDFPIAYIQLIPGSPAAVAANAASPFNFPVFPVLNQGDCRTITTTLIDLPPGAIFSYSIIAHSGDPATDPTALCCSDPDEFRELIVPDCDPCDNLGVESVEASAEGCCYDITLFNNAAGFDFDAIDICVLNSNATLSVYNALGSPLTGNVTATGERANLTMADGSLLPLGNIQLPTICIEDGEQPFHLLEIKWTNDKEVICRDTIEVFCEPDCGYLTEESVDCDGDVYVWTGTITNTSPYTMSEAYVQFDPLLGLSAWDQSIPLGSLLPGQSTNIQIEIGSPAGPLDSICFTVVMHEAGPDDLHLNCCAFEACIQLPDCAIEECNCEDLQAFRDEVRASFDTIGLDDGPFSFRFDPRGTFTGCDSITWIIRELNPTSPWEVVGSGQVFDYTFLRPGRYQIWMRVTRTADDGSTCSWNAFRVLIIEGPAGISWTTGEEIAEEVTTFPNPAHAEVNVTLPGSINDLLRTEIELLDFQGRVARTYAWDNLTTGVSRTFRLDVRELPAGVYLLRGQGGESGWTKKVIIE